MRVALTSFFLLSFSGADPGFFDGGGRGGGWGGGGGLIIGCIFLFTGRWAYNRRGL